ncbi:MAG: aminopeptidase P family protein [Tissierellia bacterium]|nr:aminopeptidase P family protein [Tissierellia bacterium]
MNTNEKLKLLREKMKRYEIDAYIVPTSDPHKSEYLPEHFKTRQFISGFTGSQGTAVITMDKALVWADGRYFIQCEKEIAGTEFEMMKINTPGFPDYVEYLHKNLQKNDTVAFDGATFSQKDFEKLKSSLPDVIILDELDLISEIWENRPQLSDAQIFIHEEKYTGLSAKEKIEIVREELKKIGADTFIISALEDICWLYNIRGRDIKNNPVVISYALIDRDYAYLFVDNKKLTIEVSEYLNSQGIEAEEYEYVFAHVNTIKNANIVLDKSIINRKLYKLIDKSNKIIDKTNITSDLKARKNDVELKNQIHAYLKDGVALTKFIYWVKNHKDKRELNEFDLAKTLEDFRREQEGFLETSFDTISAYGPNAAMMHYRANEDNFAKLKNKGLYLVDSGGQYFDGTTDITRTLVLGEITDEEKRDFTLALAGHIDLASTKFLHGVTGNSLDAICRRPMWNNFMDYKCGTGHGVGYFLGVHEGPHRLAQNLNDKAVLDEGMVVTIEPGVYKKDKYGIRHENVYYIKKAEENEDGKFLEFIVMSLAPIDLEGIDKDLLTKAQIEFLNDYHKKVYRELKSYLTEEERIWLKESTREI